MQKIRQSEWKQWVKMIKIKRTSDKIAPKNIQTGYLPLKGKANEKESWREKGKQTDEKTEKINATKTKAIKKL